MENHSHRIHLDSGQRRPPRRLNRNPLTGEEINRLAISSNLKSGRKRSPIEINPGVAQDESFADSLSGSTNPSEPISL